MVQVHAISTKDFLANNSYIVYKDRKAVVIDPAASAKPIGDFLKEHNLELQGILITHAHPDHTNQVAELLRHQKVPVFIHKNEEKMLHYPDLSHRFGSLQEVKFTFFDKSFEVGDFEVKVILAPGHTPGSTIYEIDEYWFTGDVLFEKEIGRDDYPGGSPEDSNRTAKAILEVKRDLIVMPGHNNYGIPLAEIQKRNPELKEAAAAAK